MTGFLTTPCSIENVTGTTTDADGVPTVTTSSTSTVCSAQPYKATPEEVAAGQVYAEARYRVWLPAATVVGASSVFVLNGNRFAVLGTPERWEGGQLDHVVIVAGRST